MLVGEGYRVVGGGGGQLGGGSDTELCVVGAPCPRCLSL